MYVDAAFCLGRSCLRPDAVALFGKERLATCGECGSFLQRWCLLNSVVTGVRMRRYLLLLLPMVVMVLLLFALLCCRY